MEEQASGVPPCHSELVASASQGLALALWADESLHSSVQNGTSGRQFFQKTFFSAWDLMHQEKQTGLSEMGW